MPDVIGGIEVALQANDAGLTPAFNRARQATAAIEAEMARLTAEEKQGIITTAAYTDKMNELTAAQVRLTAAMTQAAPRLDPLQSALGTTGSSASKLSNQFFILGNVLDDLQYVGEMGLRPIINNVMQISPAVGVALLAFDQLRRKGVELGDVADTVRSIGDVIEDLAGIDIGEMMGIDTEEQSFRNLATSINLISAKLREFIGYAKQVPGAFGDITGMTRRAEDRAIEAFEKAPDAAIKAQGKAAIEAIDQYGHGRFMEELVDPGGNAEVTRREKTRLIELLKGVKEGRRDAIIELEERVAGTRVGEAIRENMPGVKEGRKAFEEDEKLRTKEQAKRLGAMNEELSVTEEMAEFDESDIATQKTKKQLGQELKLIERGGDLNWRMMLMQNPTVVGKSLSLDAYQESRKGQGGISEAVKHLHAIAELDKEIRDNTNKLNELKTPHRKAR